VGNNFTKEDYERSKEERKYRARRRSEMKALAKELLASKVKNKKTEEIIKQYGFEEEDATNATAILVAQLTKALKGDAKAFELLRDTSGQKPVEQFQEIEPPKIVDDIEDSEE
jgi:hypothetical protein